nr:MAG TPA: hypothetical protein [Caudoviricetes sp.]
MAVLDWNTPSWVADRFPQTTNTGGTILNPNGQMTTTYPIGNNYYGQIAVNPNSIPNQTLAQAWNTSSFADRMNTIFGGLQTLGNLYAGLRGVSLANKQFKQQQAQWNATWDATKKGLNEALANRSYNRNNGDMGAVQRDQERYGIK